jgi:hypothetical protein
LIHHGFATGEDYLNMTEAEQEAYAMGVVNGMLVAPLFGAPKKRLAWLEGCMRGKSSSQVTALFTNYLRENPLRWNETPHVTMYSALRNACLQ